MCLEDVNHLSVKDVYFRVELEPVVDCIRVDLDLTLLGRDACVMSMNLSIVCYIVRLYSVYLCERKNLYT